MNDSFSQTLVECLGWTLVHFLWQGLVIAALLAGFLRLSRRAAPNCRYLAGCVALLLLAAAPVLTFHYVAGQYPESPTVWVESISASASANVTPPKTGPQTRLIIVARHAGRELNFSQRLEMLFPWLVLGWSLGVFALSCRLLGGWLQIQRLKRRAAGALDPIWHDK